MMIYMSTNKLKKFAVTKYFMLKVPGNNCFLPTDS